MTDEVTPIGFGGKMFDLNKLSDDQKQTIAGHQTIEIAIEQLGELAVMIANLKNLSNLAAEGLRMAQAQATETFPPPLTIAETGATSPDSTEGGVLSAPEDDAAVTGGDGVAPPTDQEGDLH